MDILSSKNKLIVEATVLRVKISTLDILRQIIIDSSRKHNSNSRYYMSNLGMTKRHRWFIFQKFGGCLLSNEISDNLRDQIKANHVCKYDAL